MKEVQSGVFDWLDWKKANKGPKTREEALKVIGKHMRLNVSSIRDTLARGISDDKGDVISVDDRLSFMVWDIQENDGSLLDYSKGKWSERIISDLLTEVGNLLSTYTRYILPTQSINKAQTTAIRAVEREEAPGISSNPNSAPSVISLPGQGRTRVEDIPRNQLDLVIEDFMGYAVKALLRWKALGVDLARIKRVLAQIEEKVEAEY
jgi:hypothetical protein